jgi:hypothetical protein
MPIRFRCQHCNQLLGIARRKSGTHVECPTCHQNVLVPAEEGALAPNGLPPPAAKPVPPPPVPAPAPVGGPALFERDDFELLLRPQASMAGELPRPPIPAVRTPVPSTRPHPSEPMPDPLPAWPPPDPGPPIGVILSPTRATILTVVVILLLAVAFGAGLLVGRFYL